MIAQTTVQFVIERPAPGDKPNKFPFPHVVWVYWPPEPRRNYKPPCSCQSIFRVTDESVNETVAKGAKAPGPVIYVCPCMGEVIE